MTINQSQTGQVLALLQRLAILEVVPPPVVCVCVCDENDFRKRSDTRVSLVLLRNGKCSGQIPSSARSFGDWMRIRKARAAMSGRRRPSVSGAVLFIYEQRSGYF